MKKSSFDADKVMQKWGNTLSKKMHELKLLNISNNISFIGKKFDFVFEDSLSEVDALFFIFSSAKVIFKDKKSFVKGSEKELFEQWNKMLAQLSDGKVKLTGFRK